jgi:energy-coupling factor transporter transmembrane protein EcfT
MFVWIWLCGLPWKMQVGLLLYAILLFSPFFLFTPWLETTQPPAGYNWFGTAKIPLEISLRGTACIFVSASTIAVLDLAEFNVGLASLPIPPTIRHLLIQIVHQTAMLTNESQRISSAVQIRGLPSGFTPRLKFLSALPTIWLLRIMHRADRIAAAMDLRGFENTPCASRAKLGFLDGFAMFTALLLLGATITMRWMEVS